MPYLVEVNQAIKHSRNKPNTHDGLDSWTDYCSSNGLEGWTHHCLLVGQLEIHSLAIGQLDTELSNYWLDINTQSPHRTVERITVQSLDSWKFAVQPSDTV